MSSYQRRNAYSRTSASAAPGQPARWEWPNSRSPPVLVRPIGIRSMQWVRRPTPQRIAVGPLFAPSCPCHSSRDPLTHADVRLAEVPPLYEKDHEAGGVVSGGRIHMSITSWPGVAFLPTSAISAGDRYGSWNTSSLHGLLERLCLRSPNSCGKLSNFVS